MGFWDRFKRDKHTAMVVQGGGNYSVYTDPEGGAVANSSPITRIASRLPGRSGFTADQRHRFELELYHSLRELIPVLNDAISKRRAVEGLFCVETGSDATDALINAFIDEVPIGYVPESPLEHGLNTFLDLLSDSADEYGLGIGEIDVSARGRRIKRLLTPDMRTFSMADEDNDGDYQLYQTQNGVRTQIDGSKLLRLTFSTGGAYIWPRPMAWGLPFVTELLVRMIAAANNGWLRFGDPWFVALVRYAMGHAPQPTKQNSDPILDSLKKQIETLYTNRKIGKSGDAFFSVAGAEEVEFKRPVDVDASILKFFAEHQSVVSEQIWSRSDLPSWLMPGAKRSGSGLSSDRFEQEAILASDATRRRQDKKARIAKGVIDYFLLTQKRLDLIGSYQIVWKAEELASQRYKAETREIEAKTVKNVIENAELLFDEEGKPRFDNEARSYLEKHHVLQAEGV